MNGCHIKSIIQPSVKWVLTCAHTHTHIHTCTVHKQQHVCSLNLTFVNIFPCSTPKIYENPRRPNRSPGGSGLLRVPGHRGSTAQDCLEQKRQKSQQPEIWGMILMEEGSFFITVLTSSHGDVLYTGNRTEWASHNRAATDFHCFCKPVVSADIFDCQTQV